MIDDELPPRPVKMTAAEVTARREAAEFELGVLRPSDYERSLHERTAARLSGEDVPMAVLLAADTGHDIDFDPERLGLTARTPEL